MGRFGAGWLITFTSLRLPPEKGPPGGHVRSFVVGCGPFPCAAVTDGAQRGRALERFPGSLQETQALEQ